MTDNDGTIIAEVRKSQRQRVRVSLASYRGHEFCDVRVYFDNGNEFRPTAKGITIPLDRIGELAQALVDAEVEARRRGLLDDDPARLVAAG